MLRYQHRLSKDIDIFVPDPQYLGFVTPRLSDVAADISSQYVEDQNSYVKLIRPEGKLISWHPLISLSLDLKCGIFLATPFVLRLPWKLWPKNFGTEEIGLLLVIYLIYP